MKSKMTLTMCVRKNLQRIRKLIKMNHTEFADMLGLERTAYGKRETGDTPLTLPDMELIMNKLEGFVLQDLFLGYPGFDYFKPTIDLDEEARVRFPWLDQVILAANQITDPEDTEKEEDIEFLQQCLRFALVKLERKRLGEKQGDLKNVEAR